MSILQEIIEKMTIDPELLQELSEEQKQMIFCKIREEQIRRYEEREKQLEKEPKKKQKNSSNAKKIGNKHVLFLSGSDGNEWVWVMGEHKSDKSIEEIFEEEAQEKAHILAEKEAEELTCREEEEVQRKLAEEQEILEKERKQKEEEEKKKQEQLAVSMSVKHARKAFEKLEKEKQQREEEERKRLTKIKNVARKELDEVKRRDSKRRSGDHINSRSSEYFESILERRKKLAKEAEENQKALELEWQKQEERAKVKEREMREIARRARRDHKMSKSTKKKLEAVTHMIGLMNDAREENPPLASKKSPQIPRRGKMRPAKPSDRHAVVQWFVDDERPHKIGLDDSTKLPHIWFHGIIKRQEAERLLAEEPVGAFLVRVSERVWGYAISYRAPEKCKHFLIDSSEGKYQFFGIDQIVHDCLADLVNHHKTNPISELGQEYLIHPSGQVIDPPDYYELFSDLLNTDESTYL